MHLHILGICGTFMGGLALLARQLGHRVSGQDANVYPPMSDQLAAHDIALTSGWDPADIPETTEVVVVGNALSRGNPALEWVLARGLRYTSGPQWLAEAVLPQRWVVAVAGTHGKSSTASMVATILEEAGLAPGFLIGAVPANFGVSARLGETPFFVVEADEYDSAFCDKRSKFVHYHPRSCILNNLEFDHGDIFPDLAAIQRQFHHLVRTVPNNGLLILPHADAALDAVLSQGCWTPQQRFGVVAGERAAAAGDHWSARLQVADGSRFEVLLNHQPVGEVVWQQVGLHSVNNGLAALAAARHCGVPVAHALAGLSRFTGVKRRLEVRGVVAGVTVYDDFAHHPTAIATTLDGLRRQIGTAGRIIAVLEPRSNTMRLGHHRGQLAAALAAADFSWLYTPPNLDWDGVAELAPLAERGGVQDSVHALIAALVAQAQAGDHLLIMSNGGFEQIHQRLLEALAAAQP